MRELRVVYNPKSKRGKFITSIDKFIDLAQRRGFRVSMYRLSGHRNDTQKILNGLGEDSILVVCGGDGTLQLAVEAIVENDLDIPVGLLPFGTSNDFADSIGLTTNPKTLMAFIDTDNVGSVDVGRVGNRCFVNVFSAGQLIKSSHTVDRVFKDQLGMLAYYLHSVGQLPKITPFTLTLSGDIEDQFSCLLLVVLNSTSAGGFRNLAPDANLQDGYLDILAIRECSLPDLAGIFFGALRGDHIRNPAVHYTKAANLTVSGPHDVATDIDGEYGPNLPVNIWVLPKRLQLLGAKNLTLGRHHTSFHKTK